jgi:STE24 endopeptidase
MEAYHRTREAFGLIRLLVTAPFLLWFFFGSGLRLFDRAITGLSLSPLLHAVAFFVVLSLATSLLELPFDLYSVFRIEERHGFNRMTFRLFAADWVKGNLLGTLLTAMLAAVGLLLFRASPNLYWLWLWGFAVAFGTFLMLIAPYVIEPLFIKTTPLRSEQLANGVRELASRSGVQVTKVLEMDASRRTSHSNAYFTGIGRVKRVVLFDTLLERLSEREILGVLAHELGHWKLRHVTQRLVTTAVTLLALLYLGKELLSSHVLTAWFGLAPLSLPAEVLLLGFLASTVSFFATPLSAFWSRHHEWQADAYAQQLTREAEPLAIALIKLAKDNLSNLHPHPWYAAFYYSHPTTIERATKLMGKQWQCPVAASLEAPQTQAVEPSP